jgi:hypothetical protein
MIWRWAAVVLTAFYYLVNWSLLGTVGLLT